MSKKHNKKKDKAEVTHKIKNGVESSVHELLGGTFLTKKKAVRLLPFVLYLTFLALLYIANTYYAEKKIREMDGLRKEMKELRYEYISTKSELMFQTKQSELAKQLEEEGIKESTHPPKKIHVDNN